MQFLSELGDLAVGVLLEVAMADAMEDPTDFFEESLTLDVFRDQCATVHFVVLCAVGLYGEPPSLGVGHYEVECFAEGRPLRNDGQTFNRRKSVKQVSLEIGHEDGFASMQAGID